jgi:hypothetical protein
MVCIILKTTGFDSLVRRESSEMPKDGSSSVKACNMDKALSTD